MVYWVHDRGFEFTSHLMHVIAHCTVEHKHVGAYCIIEHMAQEIILCSAY